MKSDPNTVSPFEGFDEFTFGNGPVKEGIVRRGEVMESEEEGAGEEARDEQKEGETPDDWIWFLMPPDRLGQRSRICPKTKCPKRS